jgi:Protein of unknown function (DUF3237)
MTTRLGDNLPPALQSIRTRPLFVMRLEVRGPLAFEAKPRTGRRVGIVTSGAFEGERLSGRVLDGGSDWQMAREDGSTTLDVRLLLKTSDDTLIGMSYRGVRHGPREVLEKIARGEVVDPSSYYFRINPIFEAAAGKYDWLNRIVAIGSGHRLADGPIYSVFEVV